MSPWGRLAGNSGSAPSDVFAGAGVSIGSFAAGSGLPSCSCGDNLATWSTGSNGTAGELATTGTGAGTAGALDRVGVGVVAAGGRLACSRSCVSTPLSLPPAGAIWAGGGSFPFPVAWDATSSAGFSLPRPLLMIRTVTRMQNESSAATPNRASRPNQWRRIEGGMMPVSLAA